MICHPSTRKAHPFYQENQQLAEKLTPSGYQLATSHSPTTVTAPAEPPPITGSLANVSAHVSNKLFYTSTFFHCGPYATAAALHKSSTPSSTPKNNRPPSVTAVATPAPSAEAAESTAECPSQSADGAAEKPTTKGAHSIINTKEAPIITRHYEASIVPDQPHLLEPILFPQLQLIKNIAGRTSHTDIRIQQTLKNNPEGQTLLTSFTFDSVA